MTLIGATTENPSFEVNSALLSRARVFVLQPLSDDEVGDIVDRALDDSERGLGDRSVASRRRGSTALGHARQRRRARRAQRARVRGRLRDRAGDGARTIDAALVAKRCSGARRSTTKAAKRTTT